MPTSRSRSIVFLAGLGFADLLVQDDRFHDLRADGEHRVERRHRLLEDHADVAAADRLHLPLGQPHEVVAEERDAARFDAGGRRQQPHDRERRDALAGAAFADDAERAARLEAERQIVDGVDDAFFGVEVGAEVGDFEDGGDIGFRHLTTKARRARRRISAELYRTVDSDFLRVLCALRGSYCIA